MAITIKYALREDSKADPADVLTIKKALTRTGHYEIPDYGLTPYPDKRLFNAIKLYQREANLKVDGIITPKGETIKSLNADDEYADWGNPEDHEDDPDVKTPTIWCPECGGPHGGSKGDLCPDCDSKL